MKLLYLLVIFITFEATAQVSPFLSTTWNQTCNYNAQMPSVGSGGACGNAFTGCNATAMAQILKYYAYPAVGVGSHCNTNSPTDCVDFGLANYDYSLMPNNVSSANAQVATLMYDLGVAVDMNWNGTNSVSFFSSTVLKENFWYSPKLAGSATFLFPTTAALIQAIKDELDLGRPVYAKGGGHFYLIDGYNASDEFHMNFGWGGTYDGYYPINSVSNGAGTFTPTNFIIHIEPMSGDLETAKDTLFISANATLSEVVEFTSKLDWTMSSPDAWITPNVTSGLAGYQNVSASGASFAALVNNGPERIGSIVLANANSNETIVVVQAASAMTVSPTNLNVVYTGATETIDVTHNSWVTWDVTTSELWMSISPGSGTGNASFDITIADNTGGTSRTGFVLVTGGGHSDSIEVFQADDFTVSVLEMENEGWMVSPNPTHDKVTIEGISKNQLITVYNLFGGVVSVPISWNGNAREIDFSTEKPGVYFIEVDGKTERVMKL